MPLTPAGRIYLEIAQQQIKIIYDAQEKLVRWLNLVDSKLVDLYDVDLTVLDTAIRKLLTEKPPKRNKHSRSTNTKSGKQKKVNANGT